MKKKIGYYMAVLAGVYVKHSSSTDMMNDCSVLSLARCYISCMSCNCKDLIRRKSVGVKLYLIEWVRKNSHSLSSIAVTTAVSQSVYLLDRIENNCCFVT